MKNLAQVLQNIPDDEVEELDRAEAARSEREEDPADYVTEVDELTL